jgi:hypothetical protein
MGLLDCFASRLAMTGISVTINMGRRRVLMPPIDSIIGVAVVRTIVSITAADFDRVAMMVIQSRSQQLLTCLS